MWDRLQIDSSCEEFYEFSIGFRIILTTYLPLCLKMQQQMRVYLSFFIYYFF